MRYPLATVECPRDGTDTEMPAEDKDLWARDDSRYVGRCDGPVKYIPMLGIGVPTFIERREDLYPDGHTAPSQMHHVPPKMRVHYKLEQLPDDMSAYKGLQYMEDRVRADGFALCNAKTQKTDFTEYCNSRAVNRSGYCSRHGGRLHPLDRVINLDYKPQRGEVRVKKDIDSMTRHEKLMAGIISVDDLDDEELARGQCRDKAGGFNGMAPKTIPKELHDRMVRELFGRADNRLKENLLDVVDTMTEIANAQPAKTSMT